MITRQQKIKELHQYLVQTILLTKDEAEAVISFKNGYKILNENIRQNTLDKFQTRFCDNLVSGLSKLPKTNSKIVFRNLNFADFQLNKIISYYKSHLNQNIFIPDFQSCTKLNNFTGNIDNDYNFTLIITPSKSTAGAEIHTLWNQFDLNDVEQEVIFPMNTSFEISSLNMSKRITVDLLEITERSSQKLPAF